MTGWLATPVVEIGELAALSSNLNPQSLFRAKDVWMFPMDQRLIITMKKMQYRVITGPVLITFQNHRFSRKNDCLLMQSYWTLGFNIWILGVHEHSDHNRNVILEPVVMFKPIEEENICEAEEQGRSQPNFLYHMTSSCQLWAQTAGRVKPQF